MAEIIGLAPSGTQALTEGWSRCAALARSILPALATPAPPSRAHGMGAADTAGEGSGGEDVFYSRIYRISSGPPRTEAFSTG